MVSLELRNRAVGMVVAGKQPSEVAKILGVSKASVNRWCSRSQAGKSLQDAPRSGRPSALSRVGKIVVAKSVGKRWHSVRKLSTKLTNKGHPVSRESVRRYLKNNLGLKSYSRPKKPFLTQKMRTARLKFARDHAHWTTSDWENVLWSDECYFHLFPKSNSSTDRVWSASGDDIEPVRTVKHPPKVMVWGMFSASGVSKLHFVPQGQTVNGQYYREMILAKEGLEAVQRVDEIGPISSRRLFCLMSAATFMQDSAPPHVTRENYLWLDMNFPKYWRKGEWPGNSPNLNPIENLWAIMKEKVGTLKPASTLSCLKKQLLKTWETLDESVLKNLAQSMPQRMKKVIAVKGDFIGY